MGRIFAFFLLLAGILAAFYFYKGSDFSFTSPIPKVFGASSTQLTNNWFPKKSTFNFRADSPLNLSANSAILVNFDTGEIVYAKNIQSRAPIASLTKIMTALVALSSSKDDAVFEVSQKAATVGEDSMGLSAGEKLAVDELLYGLMLPSGNDAAVTIAEGVSGSEDAFVSKMNEKARLLGMSDTRFINASGLDEDGRNPYSTAYDLAVLSHYAMQNFEKFRQVVSTEHYAIDATDTHKAFDLYNETNLLTTYPGVKGIKPGFTWEAGLCLATYAENKGVKLLGVILGSDNRRGEMKELLDYGFAKYGIKVSHPALDL